MALSWKLSLWSSDYAWRTFPFPGGVGSNLAVSLACRAVPVWPGIPATLSTPVLVCCPLILTSKIHFSLRLARAGGTFHYHIAIQ